MVLRTPHPTRRHYWGVLPVWLRTYGHSLGSMARKALRFGRVIFLSPGCPLLTIGLGAMSGTYGAGASSCGGDAPSLPELVDDEVLAVLAADVEALDCATRPSDDPRANERLAETAAELLDDASRHDVVGAAQEAFLLEQPERS